jgi:ATP-dependent helicase/nuclease subunit A
MSYVRFTAAQLDATDVSKRHLDACVVAGPGSGKTTVLVEYFRRLVEEGVDPLRILAITFTEKAAGNMRSKLAAAFQDKPVTRAKLERAWVSTVHGFCARLLRENAVFAGIDPEFTVADERDSWRMQEESIRTAIDELFRDYPAGVRALIRGLSSYEFEEAVLSAYDAMRGAGVRVEDLPNFETPRGASIADIEAALEALHHEPPRLWNPAQIEQLSSAVEGALRIVGAASAKDAMAAVEGFSCNLQKCKRGNNTYEILRQLKALVEEVRYTLTTEHYAAERRTLLDIFKRFDRLYRDRKRQAAALDFADLEEFTVRLLEEHPETRARLQAQFDHVVMDEFQDTNPQQAKLLSLVRPPDRFYAVGDINQSIFGFRHAEPRGFSDYRDEVKRTGRHLVELEDNFRSRAEVLSAVGTITDGLDGIEQRSLVAGRKFETPRPVCVEALAVTGDESMEAQWVARRIADLLEAEPHFQCKDIAVLLRNTEVLGAFTAALDEANIPYVVNRGRGFYDTREVNDLTHLLRVIANPLDEISLAVVLRSPLVAVSDEALIGLRLLDTNIGAALQRLDAQAGTFSQEDRGTLLAFRDRLHAWRLRREYVSFDRLLLEAMDDCGYRPEAGARGAANIDKFLAQTRAAASHMSLDEWVEELAMVRAANPREPDAPPEDSVNAVKLMTVHSAKGLEFPVVFVAALHKGIDTTVPVAAFSPRIGLGARWRNPFTRDEKDDLFQHAIRDERKKRESEESHRLLYVALTRAEQHLVLSFTVNSRKPANWAKDVIENLHLDYDHYRDEVVTRVAPDGTRWQMRIVATDRRPALKTLAAAAEKIERAEELLPTPAPGDLHDGKASVTDLRRFAACPREYYLGSYLGFEGRVHSGGTSGTAAADLGTQVHALLAGESIPDADPEAARLAGVFRQSALGRRTERASRIEREFAFLMSMGDLVLSGQIDLWFEEGGELAIIDYKTDAVTAQEARERARDYALQLRLYAQAVERVAGRQVDRAWLHFLKPNTVVEVDLAPSLLDSPEQVIADFEQAQTTGEFPLRESAHCARCAFYRGLCPART